MKKIDNCENSTVLVALLLAGILLVMGAYRLFSWLCSRGLTDTLTWVLGAAALVLAALGLLLASRSFRRLYLSFFHSALDLTSLHTYQSHTLV